MTNSKRLQMPSAVEQAFKLAKRVRKNAYAPYSKFLVGSAIVDSRGRIYAGCNVENASYGATLCAERTAAVQAIADHSQRFDHVVVVTDLEKPVSPCALCLQVLGEFAADDLKVWIANMKGVQSVHAFKDLLPYHFGPSELRKNK